MEPHYCVGRPLSVPSFKNLMAFEVIDRTSNKLYDTHNVRIIQLPDSILYLTYNLTANCHLASCNMKPFVQ